MDVIVLLPHGGPLSAGIPLPFGGPLLFSGPLPVGGPLLVGGSLDFAAFISPCMISIIQLQRQHHLV